MLRDLTGDNDLKPDFKKWVKKLTDKIFNCNNTSDEVYKLSYQQMQTLKSLHDNKYNIIKGYRTSGLTTMLMFNTLYNLLYKENGSTYHVLYLSESKDGSKFRMNRFLKFLADCEEYIVMTEKNCNTIELLFDAKPITIEFFSQYEIIKRRGKVEKINEINIDNAGWFLDKDTNDSIALLAKETKSDVTIASCPNGEKGLFYETWNECLRGTLPFKMSSLKWYLDDRFNKNLRAGTGLESYNIDNIGMLFEAIEKHDMITSDWYEERRTLLGSQVYSEVDAEFV